MKKKISLSNFVARSLDNILNLFWIAKKLLRTKIFFQILQKNRAPAISQICIQEYVYLLRFGHNLSEF